MESTVGEGSRFLFTAKLAISEREAPQPVALVTDVRIPESLVGANEGPVIHILLADDSEDNRFLIAEYVKRSPCILDVAENGEIALGMMKSRHYDLVLMDAHMPVMDGFAATKAMREWEQVRNMRRLCLYWPLPQMLSRRRRGRAQRPASPRI